MPHAEQPSYEELAARNADLTARVSELLVVVAEQAALIETLRAEVAALRRQAGRVACAVQVLDIPPAALTVTEYQMMSRACGCGQVTTAPAPAGVTGGPVCYGPDVTDAATLLASTDVIGVERAADLMGALLKAPVSTGFVSRCLVRLDAALITAGFEDALKGALRTADVLGTDETPPRLPPWRPARKTAGTRTSARCGPCAPIPAAGRT
jgi:hypothetical protein